MYEVYEPREDSFLLLKHIKEYAKDKKVLEIGTGSGILAFEASKYAKSVLATDINKNAIHNAKQKTLPKNLKFIYSNLFSNVRGKFDLILFNPPYLPSKEIEYIELDGGNNGTEIIEKFLKQAGKFLNKQGKILMICSSLNKNIEGLFNKYNYKFKKIDEQSFFFEKLFVFCLWT